MNFLVSIAIPAYKITYLADTINSVLNQTYKNIEIIIVNDKSPEDITSVVLQFKDNRIRYYINELNIGYRDPVSNWNKCLSYARGDFFCLLCDDDLMDVDFIEKMVDLAIKYPQISVFRSRVKIINQLGHLTGIYPCSSEWLSGVDYMLHLIKGWQRQTISEFLYRRDFLVQKGGYVAFPKAWCADWFSILNLIWEKGIITSPEVLITFRDSGLNISSIDKHIREKVIAQNMFTDKIMTLLSTINDVDVRQLIVQSRMESVKTEFYIYLSKSSWSDYFFLFINHKRNYYKIPFPCFLKAFCKRIYFLFFKDK